jgi:twitching motility protein PilI
MNDSNVSETPLELLIRIEHVSRQAGHQLPEKIETKPLWRGIAFVVEQWRLLAPLEAISDVVECGPVTAVPRTKDWLRGVANVRGTLYSVTDLACFLGRPPMTSETEGTLLVLNDKALRSAILVNDVYGLKSFDEEQHDAGNASASLDADIKPYVSRAFKEDDQIWAVFDVHRLIGADAFLEVEWRASA